MTILCDELDDHATPRAQWRHPSLDPRYAEPDAPPPCDIARWRQATHDLLSHAALAATDKD